MEKTLGERLRLLRTKRGFTLNKLASMSETWPSYLSDLERGERGLPSTPTLIRLADALRVSLDTLLGREPLPKPLLDEADLSLINKLKKISPEDRGMVDTCFHSGDEC